MASGRTLSKKRAVASRTAARKVPQDDGEKSAEQDGNGSLGERESGESDLEELHDEDEAGDHESDGSDGESETEFDEMALDANALEDYTHIVVREDTCTPSCVEDKFDLVMQCVASIAAMTKAEKGEHSDHVGDAVVRSKAFQDAASVHLLLAVGRRVLLHCLPRVLPTVERHTRLAASASDSKKL